MVVPLKLGLDLRHRQPTLGGNIAGDPAVGETTFREDYSYLVAYRLLIFRLRSITGFWGKLTETRIPRKCPSKGPTRFARWRFGDRTHPGMAFLP